MYDERLRDGLPRVRERIERALERAGRAGDEVTLVAVTKGHAPAAATAAIEAGIGDLGENRVQELEYKVAEVGRDAARWHMVGHLQRNKARQALPLFDRIQSIDSLRIARRLSREAERADRDVVGLVQVNASGEDTKGGFSPAEAVDAVGEIATLPRLRIRGLMTMAPWTSDEEALRRTFGRTRRVFEDCAREIDGFEAIDLSMGMSNDFEVAVEEGSTMVRLGTVLFGERER